MTQLTHDPTQPEITITSAGQQITMRLERHANDAGKQSATVVVNGYRVHVETMRPTVQTDAKIPPKRDDAEARKPEIEGVQNELIFPSLKRGVIETTNAMAAEKLVDMYPHVKAEKTMGTYRESLAILRLMIWSCSYEMELFKNDGVVSPELEINAQLKLAEMVNLTW